MKLSDFLAKHKIKTNPFAEEDAQTDEVFKDHCISSTYHPAWDKVYGNPSDPSTSIVFGEKGAGKTALRLQVEEHIDAFNLKNPEKRCFTVSYDDLNPFLDQFKERSRIRSKQPEKVLSQFQLWDHMDAIMSLAVTKLVSKIIEGKSGKKSSGIKTAKKKEAPSEDGHKMPKGLRKRLDSYQRRDLMLLASCYDNAKSAPLPTRWNKLRSRIGGGSWGSWWPIHLAVKVTLAVVAAMIILLVLDSRGGADAEGGEAASEAFAHWDTCFKPYWWAYLGAVVLAWIPWLWRSASRYMTAASIAKRIRVLDRGALPLSRSLMKFSGTQLARQPLPNKDRTDDRYTLLSKLQGILKSLGFSGMCVLVDRIDEPHLITGSTEAMRAFIWPMLDNKFLKQEGLGIKFLLPKELTEYIDREDRDFYQRARLDKQNMVPTLNWTGQALFDVANARLDACCDEENSPKLSDLVSNDISETRLFESLQTLRVPRHMFKFLFRCISAHCTKHSDANPEYRIGADTFETELAMYRREQEATDRGLG